jgi:hypothetical protein
VALGGRLSEEDAEALDPLAYGIVGAVFSSVRRWLGRPTRSLTPETVISLISETVWFAIQGHGRRLGVEIDPARPVDEIADAVFAGLAGDAGR